MRIVNGQWDCGHDLQPLAVGRIREIKVPTLIVTAEYDLVVCIEVAELMEQEILGAKKVSIKGAGHCTNMDNPKEFNRVVEKFIRDIPMSVLSE
jgi:3-oxoadipate enol-lactonase